MSCKLENVGSTYVEVQWFLEGEKSATFSVG